MLPGTLNGTSQALNTELAPSAVPAVPLAESHPAYHQLLNTAASLLGTSIAQVDWGVIRAQAPALAAMEFFTVLPHESQVASLGLNQDSGNLLRFLHIAKDTSLFWTGMVYFNATESPCSAVETYFNDAGEVLATRSVALEPFEKTTLLFDHTTTQGPVPSGAAWLQVEADQPLVGYELFGASFTSPHDFFAGLQGSYRSGTRLAYPYVARGADAWTGLVAVNVGTVTGDLTLTLMSPQGVALETVVIEDIVPNTKSTVLVRDVFSEAARADGTWVLATSEDSAWTGFALWGDQNGSIRQTLSGLKAFVD